MAHHRGVFRLARRYKIYMYTVRRIGNLTRTGIQGEGVGVGNNSSDAPAGFRPCFRRSHRRQRVGSRDVRLRTMTSSRLFRSPPPDETSTGGRDNCNGWQVLARRINVGIDRNSIQLQLGTVGYHAAVLAVDVRRSE